MAKVNICDVTVLDNPSPFKNPFQFEITFECLEDLKDGMCSFFIVYSLREILIDDKLFVSCVFTCSTAAPGPNKDIMSYYVHL